MVVCIQLGMMVIAMTVNKGEYYITLNHNSHDAGSLLLMG